MSLTIPRLIRGRLQRGAVSTVANRIARSRRQSTRADALSQICRFPGILYPDRLRVKGVINNNLVIPFTTAATGYLNFIVSNPANGCINNMSGLSWLISGAHTDGSSPAPYQYGCVMSCTFELNAKTVVASTGGCGAQIVLLPLQQNQNSTSLIASNASEAPMASKIISVPANADTVTYSSPQLRKHYSMDKLFGVSSDTIVNAPTIYGFDYNSYVGNYQSVSIVATTEDQTTDATLKVRCVIKISFDIVLSARNVANVAGPSA